MVLLEERIEHVVVAFGVTRECSMVDIFRACHDVAAEVHLVPRLFELGATVNGRDVDTLWGFPLVRLRRHALRTNARAAKRVLDVVIASTALLLLIPLYSAIALAVKLSSRGPVYFRQARVGQGGEVIPVLKFRSMRVNIGSDTEWSADDSLVTAVGKVLRKTGMDEIPQLWNVVRGNMSLVGPRPERPFFVEQFKSEVLHYDDRHRVPAGLTGLAQIHGLRGDTPISERSRFDNQYIDNWSFMGDVRILLQTVGAMIRSAICPPLETTATGLISESLRIPGVSDNPQRSIDLESLAGAAPQQSLAQDSPERSLGSIIA
jgi:exopolysaccharide biosynthesis polyprenyl glycosylphosphotransferase